MADAKIHLCWSEPWMRFSARTTHTAAGSGTPKALTLWVPMCVRTDTDHHAALSVSARNGHCHSSQGRQPSDTPHAS
jgi:hypothetical protein